MVALPGFLEINDLAYMITTTVNPFRASNSAKISVPK